MRTGTSLAVPAALAIALAALPVPGAAQTLNFIAVTPDTPTLRIGEATTFTATGQFSDSSSRVLSAGGTWTTRAPRPIAAYGSMGAFTQGKYYAIGGFVSGGNTRVDAYDPASNSWSQKASVPISQFHAYQHAATAIAPNGNILAFGGDTGGYGQLDATFEYNPGTNAWTTRAPMPSGQRYGAAAATIGTKVYVVGGYQVAGNTYLSRLEIYDTTNNTWTVGPSMTHARISPGVVALNDLLYVVGGGNSGGSRSDMEVFSPSSGTWGTGLASMPQVGVGPAVGVRGRIVMAGIGPGNNGVVSYNPQTNQWTTLANLPTARTNIAAAGDEATGRTWWTGGYAGANVADHQELSLGDSLTWQSSNTSVATISATGQLMPLAAGTTNVTALVPGAPSGTTTVTVLNQQYSASSTLLSISVSPPTINVAPGLQVQFTATGDFADGTSRVLNNGPSTWTTQAARPVAAYGASGAFANGRMYVIGGFVGGGNTSVQSYDPSLNAWTQEASLPLPGYMAFQYAASAKGANGKVYTFGGDTGGYGQLDATFEFDPVQGSWTTRAPMPGGARYGNAAAAIGNRIYVVGGYSVPANDYLARLEIFDTVENTWTTGPSMSVTRMGAGVAAVDGKLYVIGGGNLSGTRSDVEIYDPVANTWTAGVSAPVTTGVMAAAMRGRIYLAGSGPDNDATLVFDPATNVWSTLPDVLQPRTNGTFGADDEEGHLYFIGGYGSSTYWANNERLTPQEVTWQSSDTGRMTITQGGLATASGSTGNVTITATAGIRTAQASVSITNSARTLDVTRNGDFVDGRVVSNPAGIDCGFGNSGGGSGAGCDANFDASTVVTLTAQTRNGTLFLSWSGCDQVNGATCTVTLSTSRNVFATFGLPPRSLTVNRGGTGSGTVLSNVAGITCGAACTASFAAGSSVQLTATGDANSAFTGWTGACAGTGTCTVTMDLDRTVNAGFTRLAEAQSLAAGFAHTLAVRGDGTLWTWGNNFYGQLGTGGPQSANGPLQVGTASNWKSVAAGEYHSLALRTDGTLWAWGRNDFGQLGDGTVIQRNAPVQIGVAADWTSITAGANHTLALKANGTLWAWGANFFGQLGNGGTAQANAPAQVGLVTTWSSVSGGGNHTAALRVDGTLWAWGRNDYGQLGDGSTSTRFAPVQVGTAVDWTIVAAGDLHTMGVRSSGILWGWGRNEFGQLGDGSTIDRVTPVQVGNASWASIAPGNAHTVATRTDGTLWAWGQNDRGQLGLGNFSNVNVPTQVGAATNWLAAAVGGFHGPAVRSDGTLWSWGRNLEGQVGDGSTNDRAAPAQITLADVAPDAFSFAPQANVAASTVVVAGPLTPTGYVAPTTIAVSNGEFCISSAANCACAARAFDTTAATLTPGQSVCVRHTSAASPSTPVTTTLTIGGVSGTFTSTTAAAAVLRRFDFNSDQKPDIVYRHAPSGATYIWRMNGLVLASDQFVTSIDPSWSLIGHGDFDGNGKNDLVWRNNATGTAYVWYMSDGVFLNDAFLFTIDPVWKVEAVADFNADGKPDFLFRHSTSGLGFVWYFNNTTPVADQFLYSIDNQWIVENVGDFDGNGYPDFFFRNTGSGLGFVWLWNGSSLGASFFLFSIDPSWQVVQITDWNNDGQVDLVFRSATSGVTFVWYTNGTALQGSDFLFQIDPAWIIVPYR